MKTPPLRLPSGPKRDRMLLAISARRAVAGWALAAMLSACATERAAEPPAQPVTNRSVDSHTSQNSLDWPGIYAGTLPCADCPGIQTRLTLANDGTFERQTQYLDRQPQPQTRRGRFTWHASGNAIALDANGNGQQYAVGEGRLTQLNRDGSPPGPHEASRVLTRVDMPAFARSTGPGELARTLEAHRWTLETATDRTNQRDSVLFPVAAQPFVFSFSGFRLSIQGSCNRLHGTYQINADGQLAVGRLASTMMACEPASMQADAALASRLAQPLQIDLVQGAQPQLHLVAASNERLEFKGEATAETRYGSATLIFLEVAAQPVTCHPPLRPETTCLNVRERVYDRQGREGGTPGAWQPLYENIDGYQHTPGVRNVLRVKRFSRNPLPADASRYVYVLDQVIESEIVTR